MGDDDTLCYVDLGFEVGCIFICMENGISLALLCFARISALSKTTEERVVGEMRRCLWRCCVFASIALLCNCNNMSTFFSKQVGG